MHRCYPLHSVGALLCAVIVCSLYIYNLRCAPQLRCAQLPHAVCVRQVSALLLLGGADPDVCLKGSGETPLFLACQQGHTECCALLLMAGADPSKARRDGYRPLDAANLSGHTACIALVEEVLADDNYLPQLPLFAGASISFAVAALSRARAMIARCQQTPEEIESLQPPPELDEKLFTRCVERARAGGVPPRTLEAVDADAGKLRTAAEEFRQESAVSKVRAAKERAEAAAREQAAKLAASKAAAEAKASTEQAEREAIRLRKEKERADAAKAQQARYAKEEEERKAKLYTEGRKKRQPQPGSARV